MYMPVQLTYLDIGVRFLIEGGGVGAGAKSFLGPKVSKKGP